MLHFEYSGLSNFVHITKQHQLFFPNLEYSYFNMTFWIDFFILKYNEE